MLSFWIDRSLIKVKKEKLILRVFFSLSTIRMLTTGNVKLRSTNRQRSASQNQTKLTPGGSSSQPSSGHFKDRGGHTLYFVNSTKKTSKRDVQGTETKGPTLAHAQVGLSLKPNKEQRETDGGSPKSRDEGNYGEHAIYKEGTVPPKQENEWNRKEELSPAQVSSNPQKNLTEEEVQGKSLNSEFKSQHERPRDLLDLAPNEAEITLKGRTKETLPGQGVELKVKEETDVQAMSSFALFEERRRMLLKEKETGGTSGGSATYAPVTGISFDLVSPTIDPTDRQTDPSQLMHMLRYRRKGQKTFHSGEGSASAGARKTERGCQRGPATAVLHPHGLLVRPEAPSSGTGRQTAPQAHLSTQTTPFTVSQSAVDRRPLSATKQKQQDAAGGVLEDKTGRPVTRQKHPKFALDLFPKQEEVVTKETEFEFPSPPLKEKGKTKTQGDQKNLDFSCLFMDKDEDFGVELFPTRRVRQNEIIPLIETGLVVHTTEGPYPPSSPRRGSDWVEVEASGGVGGAEFDEVLQHEILEGFSDDDNVLVEAGLLSGTLRTARGTRLSDPVERQRNAPMKVLNMFLQPRRTGWADPVGPPPQRVPMGGGGPPKPIIGAWALTPSDLSPSRSSRKR